MAISSKPLPLYEVMFDPKTDSLTGMGIVVDPAIQKNFEVFAGTGKNKHGFYVRCPLLNDGKNTNYEVFKNATPDEFTCFENGVYVNKPKTQFKVGNEAKQILFGPAMVPNQVIYRRDPDGTEYNVVFTQQAINAFVKHFNETPELASKLNFNHSDYKVDGQIKENFIAQEDGLTSALDMDVPKGTWMIAVKVNNKQFFDEFIENKIAKGFSVEINYTLVPVGQATPRPELQVTTNDLVDSYNFKRDALKRQIVKDALKETTDMGLKEDLAEVMQRNAYKTLLNSMRANLGKLDQTLKDRYKLLADKETGFDYYQKHGAYLEKIYNELKTR